MVLKLLGYSSTGLPSVNILQKRGEPVGVARPRDLKDMANTGPVSSISFLSSLRSDEVSPHRGETVSLLGLQSCPHSDLNSSMF